MIRDASAAREGRRKRVYLDYGATTPIDPEVLEAMMPFLTDGFGNPGSLYEEGRVARSAVESSRRTVARAIGCRDPHEVALVAGGTESDNLAVLGISRAAFASMPKSKGPGHVICSSFEHKAVLEAVLSLKSLGHDVTLVDPGPDGFVAPEAIASAMRPDTMLVSVMLANNEIGTVQPISRIARVVHDNGAFLHVDAVAAFSKTLDPLVSLGADAISAASHKICGPKGAGVLWMSKRAPFAPIIRGGGQERGIRSGTHDTAAIAGFAKACELAFPGAAPNLLEIERLCGMRDRLVEGVQRLSSRCGGRISTAVEIPPGDVREHLCCLVPLMVEGVESSEMVRKLDSAGICVSGGSACTSSTPGGSHVLKAIGANDGRGFLRITLGRFTEDAEIGFLLEALERMLLEDE